MNIDDFHFLRPYWLLAFIPFLTLLWLTLKNKLAQGNWSSVCDAELLPFILQERAAIQSRWPIATIIVASVLAIIALAGPTWERLPAPVFRNASALIIALDLSRSMDAADIKPSRLIRARYKINDILNQRKDGQTALIVYAGDVFTVTPLTEDSDTIKSLLPALKTEIMPSQGSNAASALKRAVELLQQAGLQKGQILLVTDSIDLNQSMNTVEQLGNYQLSVFAVGTVEGAPIKLPQGGFLKDNKGNIVISKLNTDDLQQTATLGGGIFQTITADDRDIQTLTASIEQQTQLQSSEKNNLLLDLWRERGPWLLIPVLLLAASSFRRGILCVGLLMILPLPRNAAALEWRDLWQTKDQQAQQSFQQQHYEQAAAQFGNPAWKAAAQYKMGQYQQSLESLKDASSSDDLYNQGNAHAQTGAFAAAIQAYQQALKLDPENADAQYNKEIIEQALEKQQQQNQQQQPDQDSQNQNQKNEQGDTSDQQDQSDSHNESGERSDHQQAQTSEQDTKDHQEAQADEQEDQQQPEQAEGAEQPEDHQAAEQQAQQSDLESDSEQNENQQAYEQWLKRIPDDPAGLLRRKFKYQYGKRKNRANNVEQW